MPVPINITFTVGTLTPGATYSPQEFAEALASILAGTLNSDTLLPGVASSTAPDQDKGLFLDLSTNPPTIKVWNSSSSAYVGDQTQTPIGGTIFWPGAGAIPGNYLVCDGTAKAKSTYPELYAALGGESSPYGQTSTDFSLPNMSRKTAFGSGSETGKATWNIGDSIGSETVALVKNNLPDHSHTITGYAFAADQSRPNRVLVDGERRETREFEDTGAISGGGNGTNTGDPFDTVSPGLVGRWIIRAT